MRKKLCLILVVRPGLLSLGEEAQQEFEAGEDDDNKECANSGDGAKFDNDYGNCDM